MAARKAPGKTASYGDQKVRRGAGGETHQVAGGDVDTLTTQQGIPVADDQNSAGLTGSSGEPGTSAVAGTSVMCPFVRCLGLEFKRGLEL
jgi:hypothetical protein